MKSIFSILKNIQSESPTMRGAMAAMTLEAADEIFAEIFGPEVKNFVSAAYLKNGVLAVACKGSAAAAEIKLNESLILAKISSKFQSPIIKRIRIII